MKAGTLSAALLATAVLAGCGGDDGGSDRVCASDAGSTACLVDRSGGKVDLEVEGFRPGSEVGVTGLDPSAQVGTVAKVGGNGKLDDQLGYSAPGGGQMPEMVVTVQGTSRSGAPVLLTLLRPAS